MSTFDFRSLPPGPDAVTGSAVLVRLVEGIGFRFTWATEALRETDLAFRPTPETMSIHELAHHVHGDIWKGLAVDAAAGLGALLAAGAALRAAAAPMELASPADPAGLPVAALAVAAVSWAAAPIQNAVSRAHERRADRAALDLTGNAEAFVSAMRRLGARNLAEPSPAFLSRVFFHTHPPIDERIASAAGWAAGPGPGGDAASRGRAGVRDGAR